MSAKAANSDKKRVRKTAPTVRERLEAARSQAEKSNKPSAPSKRLVLPRSKAAKPLGTLFGPIARGVSWITPSYLVNSWREVRQVSWPDRRETWRLTSAVIVFAVIFGGLVFGVDKVLGKLFQELVLR